MRSTDPATLDFSQIRRISVLGPSGSGKSTLARKLGEALDLPIVHLDTLFWMPNWIQRPEDDFLRLVHEATVQEEWVIDGNYSRTIDERFERAHLAIFLHYSRYRCLYRAVKRRITYQGKSRPDLTVGCPEKLDFEFVKWVWNHPSRDAAMMERLELLSERIPVMIINHPRDADRFVSIVGAKAEIWSHLPGFQE